MEVFNRTKQLIRMSLPLTNVEKGRKRSSNSRLPEDLSTQGPKCLRNLSSYPIMKCASNEVLSPPFIEVTKGGSSCKGIVKSR